MWLAPIAGTRLMVPYRISVPTPLGAGVLQATQFITIAAAGAADTDQRTGNRRVRAVRQGLTARVKCAGTVRIAFTRFSGSSKGEARDMAVNETTTGSELADSGAFRSNSFHSLTTGFSPVALWYRR